MDDRGVVKDADPTDRGVDTGSPDADEVDAGQTDADQADAQEYDGSPDASEDDAAEADAAEMDAEPEDGGGMDADEPDAQPMDAMDDAGPPDSGPTGIALLNDEFDDPNTLPNWTLRDVAEQTPAQYGTLDIDTTYPDHLVIIPNQTSFWGDADRSIFIYKMVTGDFIMHVYLRAVQAADRTMPPTLIFNSAGIMARDPASPTIGESWILTTLGLQSSVIGTRAASTVGSNTNLSAYRASTISEGELVICRIRNDVRTYYTTPNKGGLWTQTNWFVRNDLPQTLQVGIATDNFAAQPHLRAEIDWIRFAVPTQETDCTQNIPRN